MNIEGESEKSNKDIEVQLFPEEEQQENKLDEIESQNIKKSKRKLKIFKIFKPKKSL